MLDSNVLIDLITGRRARGRLLKQLVEEGHSLGCCAIQITEIFAGMREEERSLTEALLASLDYYEVTRQAARQGGLWKRNYHRKGRSLSLADVTIAAVTLQNNMVLITDNRKDYPMPELRLFTA